VSEARLRINSENVVHETIEGEVIVINLSSGSYFSLLGSAPEVWEHLVDGATAAQVTAALEQRYEAEPGEIDEQVRSLLDQLSEAGLIVPDGDRKGAGASAAAANGGERAAFVAPGFERYTDMKDYFLLDPIHEVSPEGWPKPAE
jgi:hypothetical protein